MKTCSRAQEDPSQQIRRSRGDDSITFISISKILTDYLAILRLLDLSKEPIEVAVVRWRSKVDARARCRNLRLNESKPTNVMFPGICEVLCGFCTIVSTQCRCDADCHTPRHVDWRFDMPFDSRTFMLAINRRSSAGIEPRSNFDPGKDRAFPSKQRCRVCWRW